MLVAIAALLLHMQAVPQIFISETTAATTKASDTASSTKPSDGTQVVTSNSPPNEPVPKEAFAKTESQPDSGVALIPGGLVPKPEAPAGIMSVATGLTPSLPLLRRSTPLLLLSPTATDSKLAHQRLWFVLGIAQHGAATFDAESTRAAISSGKCYEVDPVMRPFAGNASIYAVIQLGPALLDYLGRHMLTSRHSWARHIWWIPQVAGTVEFVAAGVHNLGACGSS